MNERIRELNLQAMSIVMNGNDPDGDVDKMYVPSEFTKKFAELILRELIDKISQEQDIAEQNWQCKNGVHICHKLTEHFGVEE